MKLAARKAQNLVYTAAYPFLPKDTPGKQVLRAYRRLEAKKISAGWSKVRKSYYGEAKEPTYRALKEQALKVGIIENDLHQPYTDVGDHFERLYTLAGILRSTGRQDDKDQATSLEWIIRHCKV